MTMENIIGMLKKAEYGGYLLNFEGHDWKVYDSNNDGNYKVYLGHCLEWQTPTFIPLETWAQAKGLIGSGYEQQRAKEYWSKKMAGWI